VFDVERGAACPVCDRAFSAGEPYSSRLVGFSGNILVTDLVCVACGIAGDDGG
jgi:hypothetical protein